MNIEELTLIINLVKDLADGAFLAFVSYLVVAYVLPYIFGAGAFYLIFRFFSNWIAGAYALSWFQEQAVSLGQRWDYRYDWSDVQKTKQLISKKLTPKE